MLDVVNEFGLALQGVARRSNSPKSYEKAVLFIQAATEDPSAGTGYDEQMRDMVAADLRGIIRAGNMQGRAWALALSADVEQGADGMVIGCEMGADNGGSYQPEVDTPLSKYGQLWVGGYGPTNKPLTADVYVIRGTCGHHRCFVMREDSFMGDPSDAFMTILYSGTNKIKHQIGPNGLIIDGRPVVVKQISGHDVLTLA